MFTMLNEKMKIALNTNSDMLNRWTVKCWRNADTKTSTCWYLLIARTRTDFPFKVSTKRFTQNYCFEESGWLLFPGNSKDFWTQRISCESISWRLLCDVILCRRCHGNVNLTFYSFGWRLLQCQHETISSKSVVFFVWKPSKYI